MGYAEAVTEESEWLIKQKLSPVALIRLTFVRKERSVCIGENFFVRLIEFNSIQLNVIPSMKVSGG